MSNTSDKGTTFGDGAARVGMQLRSSPKEQLGETWAEKDYDEFQRLFFFLTLIPGDLEVAVLEGGPCVGFINLPIIPRYGPMDTRMHRKEELTYKKKMKKMWKIVDVIRLTLNSKTTKASGSSSFTEAVAPTKGIVNFGNGILTINPDLITFNDDSDDELDALLASINVSDTPPLDITDIPPFICNTGKSSRNKKQPLKNYKMSYNGEGPSLTINQPLTQEELSMEDDQHKKWLDSVLLDKLKLDGELKVEEEIDGEEFIKSYTAIKEKNDPGVFVLPIRLEGKLIFML
ncbi:hypothetical protein Tco_0539840 [Tanacetum coccineum]